MKFALIALLATYCSAIKISGTSFPEGSVNNMNYEHSFQVPAADPDDRKCQEKVGIPGTLRNCKKDVAGFPINPGKI